MSTEAILATGTYSCCFGKFSMALRAFVNIVFKSFFFREIATIVIPEDRVNDCDWPATS